MTGDQIGILAIGAAMVLSLTAAIALLEIENPANTRAPIRLARRLLRLCPVTGRRRCPWHPDGGNHPIVSHP